MFEKGKKPFDELRREVHTLEKSARTVEYKPLLNDKPVNFDMGLLSYDEVLNDLDKIHKTMAVKKYLK